jgi:hypothetical protein
MRIDGQFAVCTVAELAEYLAQHIEIQNGDFKHFPRCDFSIVLDPENTDENPEHLWDKAEWLYGIKEVDTGFCVTDALTIISDSYDGGCCAAMAQIWNDGCGPEGVVSSIEGIILKTLNTQEDAEPGTMLVVEFC